MTSPPNLANDPSVPTRFIPVHAAILTAPRIAFRLVPASDWPTARSHLELLQADFVALIWETVILFSTEPVPVGSYDLRKDNYNPRAAALFFHVFASEPMGSRVELSERWAAL